MADRFRPRRGRRRRPRLPSETIARGTFFAVGAVRRPPPHSPRRRDSCGVDDCGRVGRPSRPIRWPRGSDPSFSSSSPSTSIVAVRAVRVDSFGSYCRRSMASDGYVSSFFRKDVGLHRHRHPRRWSRMTRISSSDPSSRRVFRRRHPRSHPQPHPLRRRPRDHHGHPYRHFPGRRRRRRPRGRIRGRFR